MLKTAFITVLSLLSFHPLHISVSEIEYAEKEKMLKIMMRVFVDDFEQAMGQRLNKPDLDIRQLENGMTVDKIAGEYLKEHFKISLDGKIQNTVFLGHEEESEAFIFYVEVKNVKKWKTIQISDDLMTEMFEDQSNIVHVSINDKIKSLRLTKDTPTDKLTFDN
jgi:hypothetical protein